MMDLKSRLAIGVDLGGTKIDIGLVDETGIIHHHERVETLVALGPMAIEKQILTSIRAMQEKTVAPLLGIGIGVAGQIDPQTGTVVFAPNLKWHNIALRENMEKALNLPVRIINDARALTMGEWQYGAGKGFHDILCLFIGTGIGGGVVSNGTLLCGCSNTFGEAGHMTIDYNGPPCTCGKRGCLETFCGGWGIAARARDAIEKEGIGAASRKIMELAGNQVDKITANHVVQAFRLGDPLARQLVDQMSIALVAGCASLVNILNPCRLILGGGFVEGMPEIIEIVDKGVKNDSLKAATKSLEVVRAKLGKEQGVLGSAAVIFNLLKGSD